MIDRLARAVFVLELVLLAVPGFVHFISSYVALADLSSVVVPLGEAGASLGPGLPGLAALAAFGLVFSAFAVLAVRYLFGGGEGVARVTPIVWAVALLGQAITAPATIWTALIEGAPNVVRAVALLTLPALGLFIPLLHMLVAALIARRGRARSNPA